MAVDKTCVVVTGSPPAEEIGTAGGSEAGKGLLFGCIPGGARSGLLDIFGAGALEKEDGRAVGGGDTKFPEGAGRASKGLSGRSGGPSG
jgi:hypothetical protein